MVGEKIDVFALGVMLFTALFARQPFQKRAYSTDPLYRYFYMPPEKQDLFFRVHPDTKGKKIDDNLKSLIKGMLNPVAEKRATLKEVAENLWFSKTCE